MWQWNDCHGFGCRCPGCVGVPSTTTTGTFTYRQSHECETWREAMGFALQLRLAGQVDGKAEIRRQHLTGQWVVRWVPRYIAYLTGIVR